MCDHDRPRSMGLSRPVTHCLLFDRRSDTVVHHSSSPGGSVASLSDTRLSNRDTVLDSGTLPYRGHSSL